MVRAWSMTFVVFAACSLAACVPATNYNDLSQSSQARTGDPSKFEIVDDKFKPTVTVESDVFTEGPILDQQIWMIFAVLDRQTKSPNYILQWSNMYSEEDWRFFSSAGTENSQSLSMRTVDRKVNNCYPRSRKCDYLETYNISLDSSLILESKEAGIRIKIFARGGVNRIIYLPSWLLAGLTSKVEEFRNK